MFNYFKIVDSDPKKGPFFNCEEWALFAWVCKRTGKVQVIP